MKSLRVLAGPRPADTVLAGLVGHRFSVQIESETVTRAGMDYSLDTKRMTHEPAALAFVRETTGCGDVEFVFEGDFRPPGQRPFDRLTVVLGDDGAVLRAFLG